MNLPLKKMGRQIFAFLASLQLAVVLLLSLAIILSVGTFYESLYDADTAKHYVYGTWWFLAYLVLLGANVFCAALSRFPWKRHHTGFVVVHLGIILILIGSLITLLKGYEGQLAIQEGETADRILLKEPLLYFYDASTARLEEMPGEFRFDPPSEKEPYGAKVLDNILVKIDDFLPHAQSETEVVAGEGMENPALKIRIQGSRAKLEEWIFARDFLRQRLALGPASVTYLDLPPGVRLSAILRDPKLRGPVLWVEGRLIPLKGNMGKNIPLAGKTLWIENFLPHAAVTRGLLVNRSPRPENPVVKLKLSTPTKQENHTIFAKYPELPTLHHSSGPQEGTLRLLWIPEELGGSKNELVLSQTRDGSYEYALHKNGSWGPGLRVREGQSVETGWMDFKFAPLESLRIAEVQKKYRKVIVPQGKEGPPPAIHLSLSTPEQKKSFWLGRGESQDIELGSRGIKVAYALKSVPMGFQIKLKDFQMGKYEGTQDPSEYKSQVHLLDPSRNLQEDHLIAMNQPLAYGKYKIFQASYQLNPEGPDWSVFSVAFDPGIPVKYLGSIILVLGIILIFFFRPAFLKKKVRTKVAVAINPEKDKGLSPLPVGEGGSLLS